MSQHQQHEETAKKKNKVPALRIVKTDEKEKPKKDLDKKYEIIREKSEGHMWGRLIIGIRAKKKAKREDMHRSVLLARAQLIGSADFSAPPPDAPDSNVRVGSSASPPVPDASIIGADDVALHIHFDLRILMCPVGDPTELYFSIYNATKSEFVSEEYQVLMTSQGMPQG